MHLSDLSDRLLSLCESGRFEVDANGDLRWVQPHDELLLDAFRRWKGDPTEMLLFMRDEREGADFPSNGTGKKWRAQAAALLQELQSNARSSRLPLYRGAAIDPFGRGPFGWTTNRKVAERFAEKVGGKVYELPKGTRGLEINFYLGKHHSYASENEWIVDT
jgi:hypothetical protein